MIEQQQTAWWRGPLTLILLLITCLLVFLPLALLPVDIALQGEDPLRTLRGLLTDPSLRAAVLRTVGIALLACAAASLFGVPLAFLAMRSAAPTRWLIGSLGVLPLIMPAFLTAALARHFCALLDASTVAGAIADPCTAGSGAMLIVVFVVHYFPIILFSLIAGLAKIDRSLEETARNLGATTPVVWRRVILPLATPSYLLGAALVILRIIEDAATPLVLGIDDMLAPQLLLHFEQSGPSDAPLRVAGLVLLLISALFTTLAWSALLPSQADTQWHRGPPARWQSAAAKVLVPIAPLLALTVIALLPLTWLALLALGIQWPGTPTPGSAQAQDLADLFREQLPGLRTSVGFLLVTGAFTLVVCWAFAAADAAQGWLARVARFLSTAMFAVPGVVLALAYLHLAERLGRPLADAPGHAWAALVLVVAFKQVPIAHRLISWRITEFRAGGLEAARQLGARGTTRLLRVTLPALAGSLGAVVLLGAVAGLVELSAALLLIRDPAAPYALVLFNGVQSDSDPAVWAAQGLALVAAIGLAVAAAAAMIGRHGVALPPFSDGSQPAERHHEE
jgi:iron(III) transport system permease protein